MSGWRAAILYTVAAGLFLVFFLRMPVFADADSYYHLAVARLYGQDGVPAGLEWTRFSLFAERFGDKEFLFHALLVPFASWLDPELGGRLWLALVNGLLFLVLALLAVPALGRWAPLVPLWVYATSAPLFARLVRLRPETPALILILAATWAAGRGRYRLLGLLTFLFTLAYTAFHALVGLCLLFFLWRGWTRRRWTPALLLYPLLGAGLALVVHPQFPANLEIWAVQNVSFFLHKGILDVGSEIRPSTTDRLLLDQLGWWLGIAALWLLRPAAPGDGERREPEDDVAAFFAIAAAAFGALYLLMSRFVTFFVPLATVAVLRRRAREPATTDPGRPWTAHLRSRPVIAGALVAAIAIAAPGTSRMVRSFNHRDPVLPHHDDRRALAAQIPAGARVAAHWGSTAFWVYYAPEGRYLNVLDPVFMALPHPEIYAAQAAVFADREPDVPLQLAAALDSDHLAINRQQAPKRLVERLLADPRIEPLYAGYHFLGRLRPAAGELFLRDWRRVPAGTPLPLTDDVRIDGWAAYPRLPSAAGGAIEGYVDLRRVGIEGCAALVHPVTVTEATGVELELAPYGPTRVWLDGEERLAIGAELEAVLGQGLRLALELAPGEHRLTVETCRAGDGHAGFYLLVRRWHTLERAPGEDL